MKAIRIERTGGPEVLEPAEIDVPVAAAGELLVRNTAIGVNYYDVYTRDGTYPRALPFVPGREGVGIVEAVGSETAGFAAGMRVGYPETPNLGSYAEYTTVPARLCVEIPPGIGDTVACGALLQALTAQYLVTDSYAVGPGDIVLVHAAAGGVGRLLVQFAKRRGAIVIATAGGPEKTALAREAGADHTIDYRAVDFEPEVRRITGGAGVAAVYDSVGRDTWERSLRLLRARGSLVIFGASSGPVPPIDPLRLAGAGSIFLSRPTLTHFVRTHGELAERANDVFDAMRDGDLTIRIAASYPLAEAARAHRDLEARTLTGKAILIP